MNPEQRDSILGKVKAALRALKELEHPLQDYSVPSQVHRNEVRRQLYTDMDGIRNVLLEIPTWKNKFSITAIDQYLRSDLPRLLDESSEATAERFVAYLAVIPDKWTVEQCVYIPLSGVVLEVSELRLGKYDLVSMDEARVNVELQKLRTYFDQLPETQNPDETEARQRQRQSYEVIIPSLRRASEAERPTYAIYRMVGDAIAAREQARQGIDDVIDLLRYSLHFIAPPVHGLTIGIAGQHQAGSQIVISIPSDYMGMSSSMTQKHALFQLAIGPADVQALRANRVFELASLLVKEDSNKFESAISRAMHWHAESTTYFSNVNGFLSLMQCLEAIFIRRPGKGTKESIAEGVAAVMAATDSHRLYYRERMMVLYKKRSEVSHGGTREVEDDAFRELQDYADAVMLWVSNRLGDFVSPRALGKWVDAEWKSICVP